MSLLNQCDLSRQSFLYSNR